MMAAVTSLTVALPELLPPGSEERGAIGSGGIACFEVPAQRVVDAMAALKETGGFSRLSLLTAVDLPEGAGLEMLYVVSRPSDGTLVAIKVPLAEGSPLVPTISGVWRAAEWLEREVYDLFGVVFEGHPDLRRILLLEDFVGHPLRRSYGGQTAEGETVEGETTTDTLTRARASELDLEKVRSFAEETHDASRLARYERPVVGPELRSEKIILNMGPQHPSTHGVLHFLLSLEGEIVTSAEPSIGYLHRCIEKLCESKTYKQCIAMMDRADYVSGFLTEHAFVLAAEELGGVEVPPKAEYLRVLFSELCRITSHHVWLGSYGLDLGALTPFLYCFREREAILDFFEATTGGRMMFNYFRVGGVKADLPPGLAADIKRLLEKLPAAIDEYESLLTTNEIFLARTKGVGIISPQMAEDYCLSGAMRRGSGISSDLRRDEPYGAYGDFDVRVPVGTVGDCYDRYLVRVAEMREAGRVALAALEGMPEGDHINPDVPRTYKPSAGEAYRRVESPRGELGVYLMSDGTSQPWRMKIRSPAFSNLQVAPALLVGRRMGDVVAVAGSVDVVMGEIDR